MEVRLRLTRKRVAILILVAAGISAAAAYAAIPDGNKVYAACMLKNVGTIRLIDPSLPASSPMSHCNSSLEVQVSWNQQGQPGAPGKDGINGTNGTNGSDGKDGANGQDGVSVTSAPESPGANCANGGSKFTAVNGTSYACNGADGGTSHAYTADLRGSFSAFTQAQPLSVSVSLPAGSYVLTGSIVNMSIRSPLVSQPFCQLRSSGVFPGAGPPSARIQYLASVTLSGVTTLSAPGSAEIACTFIGDPDNVASGDIISILAVAVGGVN